jgi:hypothetical protein
MTTIYNPIFIKNYNIYDIFYNDRGNIIIIKPGHCKINNIRIYINDILLNFQVEICSHGHAHIYCLYNETFVYDENKTYDIIIDDENVTTKINNYPKFENEIIMSTIVKNEDKYILQWIQYHNKLGITRFIIYDNSTDNTLHTLLSKNITNNIFIVINWQYEHIFQQTQQNHSIHAFNKSKYIGLFDIDEYINLQEPYIEIDNFISDIIRIDDVNIDTIGGFQLFNKLFFNPNNLPDDNYNFLQIYNCDTVSLYGHAKCFVIPKNVKTFSAHVITKGLPIKYIGENYAYFNHYIFLNKTNRGFNNTPYTDNSITRLTKLFNLH